ncbi:glycosyltransferase family 9 protein [Rhodanobacter koreensis]
MPATHLTAAASPVVIRFGRLGDTILLQPLLHKLHMRYGQPCRLLALGDWPAAIYSAQAEVAGCIRLNSFYGPIWMHPQRWRAVLALRRLRGSPFYISEPVERTRTKVRPMLALAGVPAEHCTFIEDIPLIEHEHWVDLLLRFGDTTPAAFRATCAEPTSPVAAAPQLQVSVAERADRDDWLRAQGLSGRPLVLLQPANKRTMRWNGVRAAEDDDKSWPAEHWAALARTISHRLPQAQVLLCGSPAEAGYLDFLMSVMDTASPRIEAAILPIGRLKALLEIAHSMVSVDTGPGHLAAAMGCPLVVLMGSREPQLWTPRSGSGSDVIVLGGLPSIRRVDEIDTVQVVNAWRALRWRTAMATAAESSAEAGSVYSAGCAG